MSKEIYIVISQTGTILSRILKNVTGAEYNHASISLVSDLHTMYSFGRLNPYNPFWGGFVVESPYTGTFKRFSNTKAVVLAISISEEKYEEIYEAINTMCINPKKYHYNYLGLCLAAFRIAHQQKNCYYCSEFVKYILTKHNIEGADKLKPIVQPIHFLNLPCTPIYCGKLNEYEFSPSAFAKSHHTDKNVLRRIS